MKILSENKIQEIKESLPKTIGNQIKKIRQSKGYSQTSLASAVGKDRQYLHKIESGKVTPNIATIAILAEALEVSLVEIVTIV
jgi:transcriptional regulator with XRE-family HTH domain